MSATYSQKIPPNEKDPRKVATAINKIIEGRTDNYGQVTLGTISLGGFFYRQRGAVTDFATFDGMSAGASVGLSPAIKMLLGIPKPAVA